MNMKNGTIIIVLLLGLFMIMTAVHSATSATTTWYLYNTAVSGVAPAGEVLQSAQSDTEGWQPTRSITTAPLYWYSEPQTCTYAAGNWQFILWTASPGKATMVQADVYRTNLDGSGGALVCSQQLDVNTTGGGNHSSIYTYNAVPAVTLSNQRLMAKIFKVSGSDVTMAYNTNDFPTRILTTPISAEPTPTPTPTAAPGKAIPGLVDAASYDAMFGIDTEICSEGGLDVGWTDAGDWMDYHVTVAVSGNYLVEFRASSPYANTQFQLKNGTQVLATVTIPNTGGWQAWTNVAANVNLTAGTQTLRIVAVTNGWNLRSINFSSIGSAVTVPVQGSYIQYIQLGYSPADLDGVSTLISQNTNISQKVRYNVGAVVTVSVRYLTDPKSIRFSTTDAAGNLISGNPLTFTVLPTSVVNVEILEATPTLTPTPTPTGPSITPTPTPTPVEGAFNVLGPDKGQMVTTTRTPVLSWERYAGTVKYEVWLNISRTDYDWRAVGNLLDRYTKVGETGGTSFSAPELSDRWTYKWYVVAIDGAGSRAQSDIGQFSVYLPVLEGVNDGVNIVNGCRDLNKNGTIEPFEDWHLPIATRLVDLMSRLTNEEKFRQCFYGAESDNPMNGFSFSYGVEDGMTTTQQSCAKTRMGIPTAFAGDKIHGWKTIYPTELGLAATGDPNLAYQCGNLQRVEQKSAGFTGMLMPLAEVDTKVLYPRFQEGCGENADEAAALIRALICGLQGGPEINPHSLMTTVKHWAGQGAGGEGALQYDAVTFKYHMKPWYAAVDANAASVMPGYNNSPYLDPSGTGANNSKPGIDYLHNVIGFKGFVVTDWLGANTSQTVASMGAGIDVLGGAPASSSDMNAVIAAIGQARLDEAARRILETKLRLGMFENPYGDPTATWNALDNHKIALGAAKKSITLLKNNGVLPLRLNSGDNLVVGGPRATWVNRDNDPNVIWQSIYYSDPYAVNYVTAFKNRSASLGVNVYQDTAPSAKVAVVVIGENSYTHGTEWTDKNPNIPADQLAVIQGFKSQGIKVVTIVITPRPYVLTNVATLSDALILVYRGGTAIEEALAGLCYGDYLPSGKLPFQLPRSVDQIGTDSTGNQIEKWDLPYDLGATDAERAEIRSFIASDLPVPTDYGNPLYPYGAGKQDFTPTP